MRRFATTLCFSGAFLFALGNAGSAQQVDSEELLGGHENPPVISDGTDDFTAVLDIDRIPFQLTYDVPSEGSDADRAHLHIATPVEPGSFAHPDCGGGVAQIIANLPTEFPIGD